MKRLRALRMQRAMSGRGLAAVAGVHNATISAIECGRYLPPPGSLALSRLAGALGVPVTKAESLLDDVDVVDGEVVARAET